MKTCGTCGASRPESDFSERKKGSGKLKSECKPCSVERARAWNEAHPERLTAAQKRYRERSRDRAAARQADYRRRIGETPGARWKQIQGMHHDLYRLFDVDGSLLYVGITSCLTFRMKKHSEDKAWWSEVDRIAIESYADRASADAAETEAIRTENPRYNVRKR